MTTQFFTIKHYNGVDYADLSLKLKDFGTPAVDLELQDNHYLYVILYKPFTQFFMEWLEKNTNAQDYTIEYYNGSWEPLNAVDESEGATKSGFLYWSRPSDWSKTTVDSTEGYAIRVQPNANFSAGTKLRGLAVLFSNDLDLEGIRSNIVSTHNNGESWILKHEAARKLIIQTIRNLGNQKVKVLNDSNNSTLFFYGPDDSVLYYSNITEFDFLEPFELREASKFLSLSMIYLDELSDEADVKWQRQGVRHEDSFNSAFNLFSLKLDLDDDGQEDGTENQALTQTSLSWR
jgi:hypothetical protein